MTPLKSLQENTRDCHNCELSDSRTHVVFGEGKPNARILFIGEAPGKNEDEQNRPFIGAAGKLLSSSLNQIDLVREEVYIANVIKCRPPDNRNPQTKEIEACLPILWEQIAIIKPRVICTLGNFAAQAVLKQKVAITKIRGQSFKVNNYHVFPMLHPAAALHQGNLRGAIKEDFLRLKTFLKKDLKNHSRSKSKPLT